MSSNTALSGKSAASSDLRITGNNIANASTVGFKGSRAEFGDVYAKSLLGGGANSIGFGVRLQNVAPNVTLTNYEIARSQVVSSMANGSLDFFADASSFTDPHLCKQKIAVDRFVVMARKNHPDLQQGLDLATFLRLGQINVSHRRTGVGPIDIALDKIGKRRKIVMRGQHFLTVPSTIVKTDLIACIPYHLTVQERMMKSRFKWK